MNEARIKKKVLHQKSVFTIRTSAKNWMKTMEKEKKLRSRRISVSKPFHLQFTHTNEAQLELSVEIERFRWSVGWSCNLHLSLIALNVGFDSEFHFFGSRDRGSRIGSESRFIGDTPTHCAIRSCCDDRCIRRVASMKSNQLTNHNRLPNAPRKSQSVLEIVLLF